MNLDTLQIALEIAVLAVWSYVIYDIMKRGLRPGAGGRDS